MAKSKKHNLSFEQDFDFDMIGICSHHNDYRLAWSLNSELHLHLEVSKEPYIADLKKNATEIRVEFPMYEYLDEENHLEYFLIKNKVQGRFLIHEKQNIDFFLFVCERGMVDLSGLIAKLRNVSSILAVFPFEAEEIDSAKKLVFY
jgi:hypothetical protein